MLFRALEMIMARIFAVLYPKLLTSRYRRREQWLTSMPRFMPASDLERSKEPEGVEALWNK